MPGKYFEFVVRILKNGENHTGTKGTNRVLNPTESTFIKVCSPSASSQLLQQRRLLREER
jgi:hypothetical protein